MRAPLHAICAELGLKGSVLLAPEGINGTLAGSPDGIDGLVEDVARRGAVRRPPRHLELKFSGSAAMPFQRLKVRLKKEIVTLGRR